jgi:hypothetical protein
VVGKILRNIGNAKTGMSNGRNAILSEAAADLEGLHDSRSAYINLHKLKADSLFSTTHFQTLLHLEKLYSKTRRMLVEGYEEACKTNHTICQDLRQIISAHDHSSLSKKLPLSLFSSPLPPILSSPLQL